MTTPLRTSLSRQMQARFEASGIRRRWVAGLYVLLSLSYLLWRATIINDQSLALSLVYYAADCLGCLLGLTIVMTSRRYNHNQPRPAPEGLRVDVLVPTYMEPLAVIRRTAMAARDIRYPHRTLLLDDGRRPEVEALARELGIDYASRPENLHAKAGNLNFGLSLSKADFVMVLDADHIAMPHALCVTLGFFADPDVAIVQTAQDYYNTNAFQYMNTRTGGIWNDQSFFFHISQPCRDSHNGATCVGTGVVYRRSALDAIGGVPEETVTEDLHTSIRLQKRGYRLVYVNDPVSYGIAEAEIGEYYKTRLRWGHGNLDVLARENVLFCAGLTLRQRLSFLSLGLVYLEGWQQVLLFAVPLGALVLGLQPFEITVFNILVVLLFPLLQYFLLQELGCGFARFWTNELFAMARWPVYCLAWRGFLGLRLKWRSSRKTMKGIVNWRLMLPQVTVMLVSLCALGYAAWRLQGQEEQVGPLFSILLALLGLRSMPEGMSAFTPFPAGYTLDLVLVAGFWASYNALRAMVFIFKTIENARVSHGFFRFHLPFLARSGDRFFRLVAMSEVAARIEVVGSVCMPCQGQLALSLVLPAGELPVLFDIRTAISAGKGKLHLEGEWIWQDSAQQDKLAAAIYSLDWQRDVLSRHHVFATPLDVLTRGAQILRRARREETPPPASLWQPALLSGQDGQSATAMVAVDRHHATLVSFAPLEAGTEHEARVYSEGEMQDVRFKVWAEQAMACLGNAGLDGAVARRYCITVTEGGNHSVAKRAA